MTYNLSDKDKEMVILALNTLCEVYDQKGLNNPKEIFRVREKIKKATLVQLITYAGPVTFHDEPLNN